MLFKRRNSDFGDPTTNRLLDKGVYNFDKGEYVDDGRRIRLLERNMVVGMWYVFVLSVLLWWLPVFGQMIAGYLGGRKAGTSTRGIIVTLIPCLIIILILVLVDAGLLPSLGGMTVVPSSMIGGVSSVSPQAGAYISGIYNSLLALMGLNGNGLIIIVVFGLIGGMMADMNKKEVAQATGNSHFYDGVSSFLSGANIGKFADLVAERVMWTLGTMDSGRKKLFHRSQPEPAALGFAKMKSLPPPSFNQGSRSGLREWIGPEPEPAFGYDLPYEEEEDLLRESPKWEPKPPRKRDRMRRNPYEEERDEAPRDPYGDSIFDSWKEQSPPKPRMKKGGKSTGTRKITPKKKAPARKTRKKPAYEDEDFEVEEEIKPRRKAPAKRTEKRDAVILDDSGEEVEPKKAPRKKVITGKKKQPALIARALETQEKIEVEKEQTASKPNPLEEKAPKPKREKIVKNWDML